MNICRLSEEIILKIFSHLDAGHLSLCCRVSKLFCRIASDEKLWKALFPMLVVPPGKDLRTYVQENCVLDRRVLKHRLIEAISQENRSSLKFLFHYHPGLTVDADVDFCNGMPPFRRPPKFEKTYHVLEKLPVKTDDSQNYTRSNGSKEKDGIKYEFGFSGSWQEIALMGSITAVFNKKCEQEAAASKFNVGYYYISAFVALISMVVQAHFNEKC